MSLLLIFRNMFIDKITPKKGAKSMIKRLQPKRGFLFGGKVAEITKALKSSQKVSPKLIK